MIPKRFMTADAYSYPKQQALRVAVDSIRNFLAEDDLQVYLVAFDWECLAICRELFSEYI